MSVMSGHTGPVLELAVAPGADALLTGEGQGQQLLFAC
jgi:putative NIF3 family GTP cyclohydrolase 1 type 2